MKKVGVLAHVPSRAYQRLGRWLLVPFALATAASVFSLTRLQVSGRIDRQLPPRDPYLDAVRLDAEHFLPNDFTIVSVDIAAGDIGQALQRVDNLSKGIRELPGVQQVLSATTVADLRDSGEEISFERLFIPGAGARENEAAMDALRRTAIFQEFLISREADAFSIYVFARRDADGSLLLPRIEELCRGSGGTGVHVLGKRSLESWVRRTIVPDLLLLGSIALAIILAFEVIMTRSIRAGIVLWTSTLLPSLWTLALFPPLGLPLDTESLFVPLVLLALSTTYGIHLFRYLSLGGDEGIAAALAEISPVIFAAGLTTIFGFLSLLGSPLRAMRTTGAMLMAGIALAVVSSLFLLPALFSLIPIHRLRPLGGARAIARLSESRLVAWVFFPVLAVLLVGIGFIHDDYRLEKYLSPRTELARTITRFSDLYGGVDEVELVVDTGRELGLLDPAVFQGVRSLQGELLALEAVSHVVCYTQFVDWVQGRLSGNGAGAGAPSETAIGESLELLSWGSSGWGMGSLVDTGYRRAKLVVRFSASSLSPAAASRALSDLLARIQAGVRLRLPSAAWAVLGDPVASQRRLQYMIRGQVYGIAIYFALLLIYTALYFRSWRWALLALLPSLCGVIVYLGTMGWAQVPLSPVTTASIAAVMGVGVDDVLCLITFYRRRLAQVGARGDVTPREAAARGLEETMRMSGSAIIQTTLIIVLALLALVFSRYRAFIQASLVAGVTFCCCTAVTLVVVPWWIRRMKGSDE